MHGVPPDLNRDGVVDSLDLLRLIESLGLPAEISPAATRADLDRDGAVTAKDLALMVAAIGAAPGTLPGLPNDCWIICFWCGSFDFEVWIPCGHRCPSRDECFGQHPTFPDDAPNPNPENPDPLPDDDDSLGNFGDPVEGEPAPPPPPDDPPPACAFEIEGPRSAGPNGGATFTVILESGASPDFGEVVWDEPVSTPADAVQVKGASLMSPTLSLVLSDVPAVVNIRATVTIEGQSCSREHTFTIRGVEILNSMGETAEFLRIGHWGEDNGGNQLSGYTSNGEVRNTPSEVFIDTDPDSYFVSVTDMDENKDKNKPDTLEATVRTTTDGPITLTLTETGPDTGVFISESLLLVSRDLPAPVAVTDDDFAVWSEAAETFAPDGQDNDRTMRATIDSEVVANYTPEGLATLAHEVPVSQRDPDERKTLFVRVRVHNEPFMDVGYDPPIDGQGPILGPIGAGNGVFDFADLNGNQRWDPGEPSEPFRDLSLFNPSVPDLNPPPFLRGEELTAVPFVSDGRGPVATTQQVFAEIERADIAWAQAGIRVSLIGLINEDAPRNAEGANILADGWLNFKDSTITEDELAVIDSIGDAATPIVAEVIFTGPLTDNGEEAVAYGLASIPAVHLSLPAGRQNNTYLLIGPNVRVDNRVLAHEIGHALTNQFDTIFVKYIFFPALATPDDRVPNSRRRLLHVTEDTARINDRDPNRIRDPGNVLLNTP